MRSKAGRGNGGAGLMVSNAGPVSCHRSVFPSCESKTSERGLDIMTMRQRLFILRNSFHISSYQDDVVLWDQWRRELSPAQMISNDTRSFLPLKDLIKEASQTALHRALALQRCTVGCPMMEFLLASMTHSL